MVFLRGACPNNFRWHARTDLIVRFFLSPNLFDCTNPADYAFRKYARAIRSRTYSPTSQPIGVHYPKRRAKKIAYFLFRSSGSLGFSYPTDCFADITCAPVVIASTVHTCLTHDGVALFDNLSIIRDTPVTNKQKSENSKNMIIKKEQTPGVPTGGPFGRSAYVAPAARYARNNGRFFNFRVIIRTTRTHPLVSISRDRHLNPVRVFRVTTIDRICFFVYVLTTMRRRSKYTHARATNKKRTTSPIVVNIATVFPV